MSWEDEVKAKGHPLFVTYKLCCAAYIFVITLCFTTLLIFTPSFRVDNFYVPNSLNTINSTSTESVNILFFDLMIKNQMKFIGIRYHDINLTFSYNTPNKTSNSSILMGTYTVPGFYQGMGKEARRRDVVVTRAAPPPLSELRVDVATHVKHKNLLWYFKEKRITAGGGVRVDDAGKKVGTEPAVLKSGQSDPSGLVVFLSIAAFIVVLLLGVVGIVFGVLLWGSLCYP